MQNESKFLELIRLQQGSGLTVRDFCSNEDIAPSTFYYWRKKLQRGAKKNDFIPLIVKPPGSSLSQGFRKGSHHAIQTSQMTDDNVMLEVVYPNGTLLRIKNDIDLVHLRALINLSD